MYNSYSVYADGKIKQWGITAANLTTVNLIIPYTNEDSYVVLCNVISGGQAAAYNSLLNPNNKTVDSFSFPGTTTVRRQYYTIGF